MYGLPWSLHSFLNICVRWLQFVTYRVSDAKSRVVDSEATLKELRGKQGALRHQLAEIQALQKSNDPLSIEELATLEALVAPSSQ
eukprot:m.29671 g.29671  ORF g.29671 m.29671 type:complete len:85 (-) comp12131_c0_seq3:31-285(-)